MELDLRGKTALVCGASRGLGYAAAHLLAEEGTNLIINSRSPDQIESAAEKISSETTARVHGLAGDITEPNFPETLVQKAVDLYGGLDILIANAGGPPAGGFALFDDETWQKAVELSFLSQVRIIRAAIPYLKKSPSPAVLTVTSYSVKQPIPNLILSNSIRAATAALTKSLALEYGKDGIRFNSILPGWTETERAMALIQTWAEKNETTPELEQAKQAAESPLGRFASPREFANAAVFLVSPAAGYITGVLLPVDGGIIKGTF